MNKERQCLEQRIREQALKMLEGFVPELPIVLAGEDWHQGSSA
jgi:single-stranded DNA-specific DHH superfamily exonuclease